MGEMETSYRKEGLSVRSPPANSPARFTQSLREPTATALLEGLPRGWPVWLLCVVIHRVNDAPHHTWPKRDGGGIA